MEFNKKESVSKLGLKKETCKNSKWKWLGFTFVTTFVMMSLYFLFKLVESYLFWRCFILIPYDANQKDIGNMIEILAIIIGLVTTAVFAFIIFKFNEIKDYLIHNEDFIKKIVIKTKNSIVEDSEFINDITDKATDENFKIRAHNMNGKDGLLSDNLTIIDNKWIIPTYILESYANNRSTNIDNKES